MFDIRTMKLRERALFKELTGMAIEVAAPKLGPQPCGDHRVGVRHCQACQKAALFCPKHAEEYELCEACPPVQIPDEMLAALVLIDGRRTNPEMTLAEVQELTLTEAMARLGNPEGSQGSSPSSSNGSRPSSTSTPASRRRAMVR